MGRLVLRSPLSGVVSGEELSDAVSGVWELPQRCVSRCQRVVVFLVLFGERSGEREREAEGDFVRLRFCHAVPRINQSSALRDGETSAGTSIVVVDVALRIVVYTLLY
jgi:hypothetical protein